MKKLFVTLVSLLIFLNMDGYSKYTAIGIAPLEKATEYYKKFNIIPTSTKFSRLYTPETSNSETGGSAEKATEYYTPEIETGDSTKNTTENTAENIKEVTSIPSKKDFDFLKIKQEANKNKESKINLNIPKWLDEDFKELNISENDANYLSWLAKTESDFNPKAENQLGYYGLYQFGKSAFDWTGYSKESFQDTKNQHKAALLLRNKNLQVLKNEVNKYEGKTINGIEMTKDNIAKFAHFLGAKTFKDWVNNTKHTDIAKKGFIDANGVNIIEYLKRNKIS